MKGLIYSVLALAAMVFALPSCNNDDALEEVQVTFTASLAQNASSRALSTGEKINKVKYEIWEGEIKRTQGTEEFQGGKATCSPTLLRGRTYTAIFFAYTDGSYNVDDLQNVTRKKNNCNDESMDAFSANVTITTEDNNRTITLTRPLAQLNFATTKEDVFAALQMLSDKGWEKEKLDDLNMELVSSSMKIEKMSTSYNVKKETVNGTFTTIQSKQVLLTDASINVKGTDYDVLATAYLFPGETTTCSLSVYAKDKNGTDGSEVVVNGTDYVLMYGNVPLIKNTRTNVIGSLLTGNFPYTIELSPEFTGIDPDNPDDNDNNITPEDQGSGNTSSTGGNSN